MCIHILQNEQRLQQEVQQLQHQQTQAAATAASQPDSTAKLGALESALALKEAALKEESNTST